MAKTASTRRAGRWVTTLAIASVALGCGDDDTHMHATDSGTEDSGQDSGTDAGFDGGTDAGTANKNVVVIRLTSSGTIDTTYGGGDGIAVVDFGSSNDTLNGLDIHTDVANTDKVVLFGGRTVPGATDTARIIGRVLADGSGLDTTGFAVQSGAPTATSPVPGTHQFNLTGLSDNAKHGHVLPDGTIIASGYTSQPTHVGMMNANRIVLVRLDAAGAPMNSFGSKGIVNANPFDLGDSTEHGFAEAYSVTPIALGGNSYAFATTGYGRIDADTAIQVAQISTLFSPTGAIDATWTGTPIGNRAGTVVVHPSRSVDHDLDPGTAALSFEARGRNIITLPGGSVLAIGSTNSSTSQTSNATEKDILVTAIDPTGDPNAITFTGSATDSATDGGRRIEIGGTDYTDEACFGADVAPNGNFAVLGCYRAQSAPALDTDAVLAIVAITKDGGGDTTALALSSIASLDLSATENDRFDVVAVSPDSTRIYAAGYTTVGGVQQMVVACFQPDGMACSGFGTSGVVVLPNAPAVTGIAVDSAGRIVLGGVITEYF